MKNAPPDDAPLEDILDYWAFWNFQAGERDNDGKFRFLRLELLKRINAPAPDIDSILLVLMRRKVLRESLPNEVSALRGGTAIARAVGAAMTEDQNELLSLVTGNDVEAQVTALACARLMRVKLPVQTVAALMTNGKNDLLALAAGRYLEAEDSVEAQQSVRARHPNEAVILGAKLFRRAKRRTIKSDSTISRIFYQSRFAFNGG